MPNNLGQLAESGRTVVFGFRNFGLGGFGIDTRKVKIALSQESKKFRSLATRAAGQPKRHNKSKQAGILRFCPSLTFSQFTLPTHLPSHPVLAWAISNNTPRDEQPVADLPVIAQAPGNFYVTMYLYDCIACSGQPERSPSTLETCWLLAAGCR